MKAGEATSKDGILVGVHSEERDLLTELVRNFLTDAIAVGKSCRFLSQSLPLAVLSAIFLLIFLGIVIRLKITVIRNYLYEVLPAGFWQRVQPNIATVELRGENLYIIFFTNNYDKQIPTFLNNLGIEKDFSRAMKPCDFQAALSSCFDISVRLDEKSREVLRPFLPVKVDMFVEPKVIRFMSNRADPKEPFWGEDLSTAALTGEIRVTPFGLGGYQILIDNPGGLMADATSSGQIHLSEQLDNGYFWQFLNKLARIKLRIDQSHTASGAISLK